MGQGMEERDGKREAGQGRGGWQAGGQQSKRAGWAGPWSWGMEDEEGYQHKEIETRGEGGTQLPGSRTDPSNNRAEAPLIPRLLPVSRTTAGVALGWPSWLTAGLPAQPTVAIAPSPNTHSWLYTALHLFSQAALGKWPNPSWPQFPSL